MRLPRNVSGDALVSLLARYGYDRLRQNGSHIRLVSTASGAVHHVTVPRHNPVRVGTLGDIVTDVAAHLGRDRDEFSEELFGR